MPGNLAGMSGCAVSGSIKPLSYSRSSLSQLYCYRFWLRSSSFIDLFSLLCRRPQPSTTAMTLSGMGRGVIVWYFLTTPVSMSNTLCVPWRFPVGPRNIPGNVQGRIVFVMVGSS